jgi:hypothetical protein
MDKQPIHERMTRHGIDPDDPRYDHDHTFYEGNTWCPHCFNHAVEKPNPYCELKLAEGIKRQLPAQTIPTRRRDYTYHRRIPDGHGCVERTTTAERFWEER